MARNICKWDTQFCLWCIPIRKGLIFGAAVLMVDSIVLLIIFITYSGSQLIGDLAAKAWYVFSLGMYFIAATSLIISATHKSKIAMQIYHALALCTMVIQFIMSVWILLMHINKRGAIFYTVYTIVIFYTVNIYLFIVSCSFYNNLKRPQHRRDIRTSTTSYEANIGKGYIGKKKLTKLNRMSNRSLMRAESLSISVHQTIGV